MAALRLGIVGVGRHGSRYAKHAAEDVDGLELVAVCRRNEGKGRALAEELGCEYVRDAHELVTRPDIDAVALVTVPSLLEELVEAAARAGKRILVEKPVAPNPAAGRRMLSILEETGVYCMAGHTLRFNTVANEIRKLIGSLGRLDSLVFTQRFPPQPHLDWIDDPERAGGGNILHTGVHCFDLIRYIAGLEPESVSCSVRATCTRHTEDNFAAHITLRGSSALAMVTCSRSTQSRNGLIEISGEHGQLVGDHIYNTLVRIGDRERRQHELPPPVQTILAALQQFAEDACSGGAPRASYRDGLVAVSVADACYRAARSGRSTAVVLPDAGS